MRLTMTQQTKRRLFNLSALIGAVLGVTGWIVRSGAVAVDARYVHADDFVVYQQSQALRHQADSMKVARFDSLLQRVDDRVGAMYCGSLPASKRAGCR